MKINNVWTSGRNENTYLPLNNSTATSWILTMSRIFLLFEIVFYRWSQGTPIPDALTSISWIDGASVQLNTIIYQRHQMIDESLKIVSNKNSVARTGVEQPCNLCPCFMSFRKISNSATRNNISAIGLQLKIK